MDGIPFSCQGSGDIQHDTYRYRSLHAYLRIFHHLKVRGSLFLLYLSFYGTFRLFTGWLLYTRELKLAAAPSASISRDG